MARSPKNFWVLLLLIVVGSIFGSLIGQALDQYLPLLNFGQSVGLAPTTVNLAVLKVTLGMTLHLNIASIIGFFIALVIYSRL